MFVMAIIDHIFYVGREGGVTTGSPHPLLFMLGATTTYNIVDLFVSILLQIVTLLGLNIVKDTNIW